MRIIGNKYIKVGQGFSLLLFFMWLSVSVLLWFVDRSSSSIYVLVTGTIILGGMTYLHLKIFEVAIDEQRIILRNLFSKIKVEKSDFKKVEKTLFSPFIFRITFERGSARSYFFMIRNATFYKAIFSFDSNYTIKALNEAIVNNELSQSDGDPNLS